MGEVTPFPPQPPQAVDITETPQQVQLLNLAMQADSEIMNAATDAARKQVALFAARFSNLSNAYGRMVERVAELEGEVAQLTGAQPTEAER
jgi:hypothetical protein